MRLVVQRVTRAEVRVFEDPEWRVVGRIDAGMVVLVCAMKGDTEAHAERLAERLVRYRIFADGADRMNLSVLDSGGAALIISQFTLAADGRKGRRPSFDQAAPPARARELYEHFVNAVARLGVACATGSFGARMEVELVNDGPVTFQLEEPKPAPAI